MKGTRVGNSNNNNKNYIITKSRDTTAKSDKFVCFFCCYIHLHVFREQSVDIPLCVVFRFGCRSTIVWHFPSVPLLRIWRVHDLRTRMKEMQQNRKIFQPLNEIIKFISLIYENKIINASKQWAVGGERGNNSNGHVICTNCCTLVGHNKGL